MKNPTGKNLIGENLIERNLFSKVSYRAFVHLCGTFCACAYFLLAYDSVTDPQVSLWKYFLLLGTCWTLCLLAFARTKSAASSEILGPIVLWALIFRCIGLGAEPLYEDDYFRYLWDGRTFAEEGNPYAKAPVTYFEDQSIPEAFQGVLDGINYPELPTIYGPVSQVIFLLSYYIGPANLLALKALLLAADLITLLILSRVAAASHLVLYAWSPLLIQEVAFSAHVDIVGVAFVAAAIYCFQRKHPRMLGLFLALAVGVKAFAVILLPLLARRSLFTSGTAFLLTILILYCPFLLIEGNAGIETTLTFSKLWEFNSSLYGILAQFLNHDLARLACHSGFVLFYLWYWKNSASTTSGATAKTPRGDILFGVFLLCSAVVNPWYLLWLLPFVVISPSAWAIAAMILVSLSYIHGLTALDSNLPPFHHPTWLRPIEYGPLLAIICWEFAAQRKAGAR